MRRRYSSEVAMGVESVGVDIHVESNEKVVDGTRRNNVTSPTVRLSLKQCRWFYFLHFTTVLCILVLGMIHNGGNRKYIPVNPDELINLIPTLQIVGSQDCRKAYVNVHASTVEENLATICCSSGSNGISSNISVYESQLCSPRVPIVGVDIQQLPFARRLTRLTEAWVLPLLPIIFRFLYQLAIMVYGFFRNTTTQSKIQNGEADALIQREATSFSTSQPSSSSLSAFSSNTSSDKNGVISTVASHPHKSIKTTLKRFLFYFLLLNFRGWGLYIGANALEDYVILPWITGNTVVSPLRTNSLSDVEHDLHYKNKEPDCWYKEVLKAHHKSAMENGGHADCYGRPFDFSDHVVLFLAHYLPIFVMEMLLYYSFPFWDPTPATKQRWSTGMVWNALYGCLFLYLHLLILHALYHTAVYFHTPAEIVVGYAVSLIMQLPMAYLVCSDGSSHRLKQYIGMASNEAARSQKGD